MLLITRSTWFITLSSYLNSIMVQKHSRRSDQSCYIVFTLVTNMLCGTVAFVMNRRRPQRTEVMKAALIALVVCV